ncbi:MAG: HAD-IA family hydrolase [Clostridia bacterium]|nr:HAD-IA family hydrolase [Clostridia bacterium]
MRAYIFDLDGTLVDSYPVMVAGVAQVCREFGLQMPEREIYDRLIADSLSAFLSQMANGLGRPLEEIRDRYAAVSGRRLQDIRLMKNAAEMLECLRQRGAGLYVYTHRGRTTETLLKRHGIASYFEEAVTSLYRFPRKPAPDGIGYLLARYHPDRQKTAYVGDRTIDMDCASRAGVEGILYLPPESPCRPNGAEKRIIRDLLEIPGPAT